MSITVDLITARKNRQIIVPEKHDATTYFNGVGAGMQFTIQDTVKGTVYNDNIPWPGIASLKQAGVANYATITGEITVSIADALAVSAYGFYNYLSLIPEEDWDTIMQFNTHISLGCSFSTMSREDRVDYYQLHESFIPHPYAMIKNPYKGLGPKIPTVKTSLKTMRRRRSSE